MSVPFNELMKNLEPPFCYYVYAIKDEGEVDYFHYGIWEENTIGLKEAQENLARLVRSLIPPGVSKILDVGCGLGTTTRDLGNIGYDVLGISPDANLMKTARVKHAEAELNLVTTSFESFNGHDNFDLILFEESSQYINLQKVFSYCDKLLNNNGYVLICDEIKYYNAEQAIFHRKNDILLISDLYGFELLHNQDITTKTLPTRNFVTKCLVENRDNILTDLNKKRKNVKEEIDSLINGWSDFTKLFEKRSCGYEIFLFKKKANIGNIFSRCRKSILKVLYFLVSYSRKALKKMS